MCVFYVMLHYIMLLLLNFLVIPFLLIICFDCMLTVVIYLLDCLFFACLIACRIVRFLICDCLHICYNYSLVIRISYLNFQPDWNEYLKIGWIKQYKIQLTILLKTETKINKIQNLFSYLVMTEITAANSI